mmetsp:Transcript_8397/g.14456  ORF Transcript_8397/g.14456 Transcript_8397/m.14456 type:complete len:344 (-) Transcript_8397:465-1496(-)
MGFEQTVSFTASNLLPTDNRLRALRRQTPCGKSPSTTSRCRSSRLVISCAVRTGKNPKDFNGDYDAIRDYLERGGDEAGGAKWASNFSFGTLLRTISETSFGDASFNFRDGLYEKMLDLQGKISKPVLTDGSRADYLKRNAAKRAGMTQILSAGKVWQENGYSEPEAKDLAIESAVLSYKLRDDLKTNLDLVECAKRLAVLAKALILTPFEVSRMVQKCPSMLDIEAGEYIRTMVWLKQNLPAANVSKLVQNEPELLMLTATQREQVTVSLALMHRFLKGASIDAMIEEEPQLLFEDLEGGLIQLRELWPDHVLHPTALSNSDPAELALAIRALSPQGARKRF